MKIFNALDDYIDTAQTALIFLLLSPVFFLMLLMAGLGFILQLIGRLIFGGQDTTINRSMDERPR